MFMRSTGKGDWEHMAHKGDGAPLKSTNNIHVRNVSGQLKNEQQ